MHGYARCKHSFVHDRFHRGYEVLTESFLLAPVVSAFLVTCRRSLVSLSHAGFAHVLVALASERAATHTAKTFMNKEMLERERKLEGTLLSRKKCGEPKHNDDAKQCQSMPNDAKQVYCTCPLPVDDVATATHDLLFTRKNNILYFPPRSKTSVQGHWREPKITQKHPETQQNPAKPIQFPSPDLFSVVNFCFIRKSLSFVTTPVHLLSSREC